MYIRLEQYIELYIDGMNSKMGYFLLFCKLITFSIADILKACQKFDMF